MASQSHAPTPTLATLPGAVQFDMTAVATGHAYRIYMSVPILPPPSAGYSVVYITDADGLFATAATQALLAQISGGQPAIVVGVGYGDLMAGFKRRMADLTPPTPPDRVHSMFATSPVYAGVSFGGADDFLRFLIEELRPTIAELHPIDTASQTLFGFSAGGLFVLHALFNRPDAFSAYVAGSPAIWWNEQAVLGDEPRLAEALAEPAPRILITVGGLEQHVPNQPPPGIELEAYRALIASSRMVDNARDLAERLKSLNSSGLEVVYHVFEDETHDSVLPATLSRAVRFALNRPLRPNAE